MDLRTYLNQKRGLAAALARSLEVPPVLITQWANGRQVPAERCPDIERETGGAVRCETLRPDLSDKWTYLRGTKKKAA